MSMVTIPLTVQLVDAILSAPSGDEQDSSAWFHEGVNGWEAIVRNQAKGDVFVHDILGTIEVLDIVKTDSPWDTVYSESAFPQGWEADAKIVIRVMAELVVSKDGTQDSYGAVAFRNEPARVAAAKTVSVVVYE